MHPRLIRPLPLLLGMCLLGVCLSAPRLRAAEPTPRLAEGVDVLPGAFVPGRQPDGNSVIFDAPDGLVVIDTGRHPQHAQRILDLAAARGRPVAAIVNTHWHLDHVSGNVPVREAWPAAEVHASDAIDGALRGFLARYRTQLQEEIAKTGDAAQAARWREEVARIDSGPKLRPTRPVSASGPRTIAGRPFVLGLAEAATRGDVWLYEPRSRVLVAGDLITLPAPFLDTACPAHWREAFAELAAVDFALLVPGHGAPMDRKGFNTYRRAFNNLLVCAAGPARARTCVAGWRRDADALLTDADRETVDGMIAYYVEERLRSPGATADCAPRGQHER
jgi:glyoxylase-like metal-dependent hydrolase (beta-lactamase superfamily II)